MNQILGNKFNFNDNYNITNKKSSFKFKVIFLVCILIIITCFALYAFIKYNEYKKDRISKILINNYDIQKLYSLSNGYQINNFNSEPFVIGLIKIDKIDIIYPILSTTNEDLLKISPCRFYGPMPNQIGNLCIAGHNYASQKHFGKISSLNINDTVQIYDLNGNIVEYIIYNKIETDANDMSCINQDTNNSRQITLVTCNTLKGTRIIIKAKENRY